MKKTKDGRFKVEREYLVVKIGNKEDDYRAVYMSPEDHLRLIRNLQEALLRRSMYDGFMRDAVTVV